MKLGCWKLLRRVLLLRKNKRERELGDGKG